MKQASTAKEKNKKAEAEEFADLLLNEWQVENKTKNTSLSDFLQAKESEKEISNLKTNIDGIGTFSFEKNGYTIEITAEGKRKIAGEVVKVEANTEDWEWDEATSTITFKEGKTYVTGDNNDTLIIPNYYDGKKVKKIASGNRYGGTGGFNIKAKKVIVSEGIEEIGEYSLGAMNTEEVYLPSTLKKIGYHAFDTNLITEIKIPSNVNSVGSLAFANCPNLSIITIPQSVLDEGIKIVFGTSISTTLTSLNIEEGTTNIPDNSFENFASLKNVNIATTVESIGNLAFRGCTSLSNLNIGNTAPNIGMYAFEESTAEFEIPSKMTKIGNRAFGYCKGLKNVVIPNTVTEIEEYAFSGCTNLETVSIPNSVKKVGNSIFNACKSSLIINCETTLPGGQKVPDGWDSGWLNGASTTNVNWGVNISK